MIAFNKTVRKGSAASFILFLLFCGGIYFFFMRDTEDTTEKQFVPYYYALDGSNIYYKTREDQKYPEHYVLAVTKTPHASNASDKAPSKPFGDDAKIFVESAISSADIQLEHLKHSLYVYVWLGVPENSSDVTTIKNQMLNAQLIAKGYSKYEPTYAPSQAEINPIYEKVFIELQKEAQDKHMGIWMLAENSPEELAKVEARAKEQKITEEKDTKRQQQEYLREANKVVITSRGKKYHYDWCQTIKGTPKTITIKQAIKRGYASCGVCEPPDREVTLENSGVYWGDNVYRGEKIRLLNSD